MIPKSSRLISAYWNSRHFFSAVGVSCVFCFVAGNHQCKMAFMNLVLVVLLSVSLIPKQTYAADVVATPAQNWCSMYSSLNPGDRMVFPRSKMRFLNN